MPHSLQLSPKRRCKFLHFCLQLLGICTCKKHICPYGEENEDVEKVITVTLKNKGKKYKINLTVKGENPAEEINDTN